VPGFRKRIPASKERIVNAKRQGLLMANARFWRTEQYQSRSDWKPDRRWSYHSWDMERTWSLLESTSLERQRPSRRRCTERFWTCPIQQRLQRWD
jgi:hypothetical protein